MCVRLRHHVGWLHVTYVGDAEFRDALSYCKILFGSGLQIQNEGAGDSGIGCQQ